MTLKRSFPSIVCNVLKAAQHHKWLVGFYSIELILRVQVSKDIPPVPLRHVEIVIKKPIPPLTFDRELRIFKPKLFTPVIIPY